MLRDVSLSDSKCWNSGHEWVKLTNVQSEQKKLLATGEAREDLIHEQTLNNDHRKMRGKLSSYQ